MATPAPAKAPEPKAAPVPAEKEPTEAELAAENAQLEAKIAALKQKLGITAAEEKDELARIKGIFASFDRDGNGYIDKDEFELLAFQCGSDLNALTPENLSKTFASINSKGDGKLTFDDFFKWIKSGQDLKSGAKGANLGLLRLKLQSKAWAKRMEVAKSDKKAADAKSAAAAKDAKADAKAPAKAEGKKTERPLSNLNVTLGKFGDAKAGVYFSSGENVAAAQAKREEVNAPEGVPTLVHVDFPLKQGFDEAQIGELSGIIEALISAVPWNQIPLPIYHSHAVDIVEGEQKDTKALRVTLFSSLDVQDLAAGVMGQAGGQPLKDVGVGSLKIELPFSVVDLKDPAFRFTPDVLKFRFVTEGDIDRNVLAQSQDALVQMSPQRAWVQGMRNSMAQFTKGFDLSMNFADLSELVKGVPDFDPNQGGAPALPAPGGPGAMARRRAPMRPRPTGLQQLKMGLAQAADFPVAAMLEQVLSQVPGAVAATRQAALYDAFRNNIVGVGRIHIQAHDYVCKIGFKGLDFVALLPPLN